MEWTNNHDLALAREVLLLEPFRLQARTVERGKVWQTIADNLNSHATLRFLVTKKSVREHLLKTFTGQVSRKNAEGTER